MSRNIVVRNSVFCLCSCFILAFILSACTVRPRRVLSNKEMVEVLVDLHRADGILDVAGLSSGNDEAVSRYYAEVLSKHGLTQADFDSSLVWYTHHPKMFDKIYPKVVARLEKEADGFKTAEEVVQPIEEKRPEPVTMTLEELIRMSYEGLPMPAMFSAKSNAHGDTIVVPFKIGYRIDTASVNVFSADDSADVSADDSADNSMVKHISESLDSIDEMVKQDGLKRKSDSTDTKRKDYMKLRLPNQRLQQQ